jgi:hypothetical protein
MPLQWTFDKAVQTLEILLLETVVYQGDYRRLTLLICLEPIMPYTLRWEPHGVYKEFCGLVTGTELLSSVKEVANDFRFYDIQYEVSDYLQAERTDFSQESLNEVRAVRIGSFMSNPRIKVALVTLDPEIQQRMETTIAARLTLHQTRLFSQLDEANVWLGRTVEG